MTRRGSVHLVALPLAAALLLGAAPALPASAQEVSGLLDTVDADRAMALGEFEAAIAQYLGRLDDEADNPDLHFNLGLAYAHTDRLGLATFHLTQAHFLAPSDDEIARSLALIKGDLRHRHAAEQADDRVAKGEPEAIFWLEIFHYLPRTHVEVGLILFCWLAFGLLLWRRRMAPSGRRDAALVLGILFLTMTLAAAVYRTGAELSERRVVPGVVVEDVPRLYDGPDRLARHHTDPDLFLGSTVLIREERGEWYRVELANGRAGWASADAVRRVRVAGRER